MNKNSRNYRRLAHKSKQESCVFEIPMTVEGTKLSNRKQIIYTKSQPQKSTKGKVGMVKNPEGMSLMEQRSVFEGFKKFETC